MILDRFSDGFRVSLAAGLRNLHRKRDYCANLPGCGHHNVHWGYGGQRRRSHHVEPARHPGRDGSVRRPGRRQAVHPYPGFLTAPSRSGRALATVLLAVLGLIAVPSLAFAAVHGPSSSTIPFGDFNPGQGSNSTVHVELSPGAFDPGTQGYRVSVKHWNSVGLSLRWFCKRAGVVMNAGSVGTAATDGTGYDVTGRTWTYGCVLGDSIDTVAVYATGADTGTMQQIRDGVGALLVWRAGNIPTPPSIKATTCPVAYGVPKASWTVANGLTVIFPWVGAAPLKGWYWYESMPGKVIGASARKGPIGRDLKVSGSPGWYGLVKSPLAGPATRSVRVYNIDALGCYVEVPVVGGTVDAAHTDPVGVDGPTGVGSEVGDILPPGADDVTPDPPPAGPFDSCGSFLTDALCYIVGLPAWLFVPSDQTTTSMGELYGSLAEKAPFGWITLARNIVDRASTTDAGGCFAGAGSGSNGWVGCANGMGTVTLTELGADQYQNVAFIENNSAPDQVMHLFRPILTVVLLVMLYLALAVFVGKYALRQAML